MHPALSEAEARCLTALAALFEKGETVWSREEAGWESIGLTESTFLPVLTMLERYGYIADATHTARTFYELFHIDPSAVQAVRAMDEERRRREEARDLVEGVRVTLRRHPVGGWAAVVLVGLAAAVTALNQLVSLLKNLGWLPPPQAG